MSSAGIGGSDESFISFAFAVVSVAVMLIYLPWLFRTISGTYKYYTTTPARRQDIIENPLVDIAASWCYIPKVLYYLACNPGVLSAGAKICIQEKVFFFRCCVPKFLKFMIRPKILVLWLWFVLFSSAMYATLTFDPHGVLGVSKEATTGDIKKAYRALSKVLHPDQNSTEAARELYVQVRRAYKALVDKEAFEEEESQRQQDFSVGVALPRFMTSRENDGVVLFGLLFLLIGAPVFVWYKWGRGDNKIPRLMAHARLDRERIAAFMAHFGVPEDPKYVEKCSSQRKVLETLQHLGLAPATASLATVASFPNFPEFVARCMEPEKFLNAFRNLGFEDQGIKTLQDYFTQFGPEQVEEFIKSHPSRDPKPMVMLSKTAYQSTRYLFEQHTVQVDQALEELQASLPFEVRTIRKLISLHAEMYELLDLVYLTEKPQQRHIQNLIQLPQRTAELLDELEPEMDKAYRKHLKSVVEQQAAGRMQRRQLKMMQKQMGL